MAAVDDILADLDHLLDPDGFDDYCPNGLQVAGRQRSHVWSQVCTAGIDLFEAAVAAGADLVLTHHGILWAGDDRRVTGRLHRRLRLLLAHDLGLAAYHLPLDAHPEYGNNALIAAGLGTSPAGRSAATAAGRSAAAATSRRRGSPRPS